MVTHVSKEEHVWVPIPGLEAYPQRVCECGAVWAPGGTQSGTNTITLVPSGSEVIRFSTTATPSVLDLCMSTGGRPTFAVGTGGTATKVLTVKGTDEASTYKTAAWQPNPNATTVSSYGTNTTFTAAGTATATSMTANGWGISYASAATAGSDAGWLAGAFTDVRGEFAGSAAFAVRTGASISNIRIFVGVFSSTPMGASSPAVHGAAFRYDTGADGTAFWRTWTNNAGTAQVTTTSSSIAVSTTYMLSIKWTASTYSFFVGSTGVSAHSTTVPTSTQNMGPVAEARTLENVAKTLIIGGVGLTTGQLTS